MADIAYQNKDVASKTAGEALIGKSLVPFGLPHLKIVGVLPTNLPEVESNELRLDNLFLLNDGAVAIIDYESDFSRENFVKYVNYIARVLRRYAKLKRIEELQSLRVVVIYTADVEWAEEEYDLGCFRLKVEAAYLIRQDSNRIYGRIAEKLERGEALEEEELVELMILPLTVKGEKGKQEMTVKAVELARKIPDNAEVCRVLAGILTFTDKFIDEEYGKKVRETMMMTRVERMIYDEGYEEGYGKAYGKAREDTEKVFGQLNCRLLTEKRYDDLRRASEDSEYREKLYREYKLTI